MLRELSGMDRFVFQPGGGADAAYLHAVYPRFQDFLDARAAADPDGVFLNDHVRGLLGL